MVAAMSLKLDQLTSTSTQRDSNNDQNGISSVHTHFSKLNFPKFEGENPSGWVDKCGRFFNLNGIGEEEKVNIASIHLEGQALEWFQGYEASNRVISWAQLSTDVVSRFGPNVYDSPMGELTKLKQISTVKIYQERFEALMARTSGLPEEFFIQCFISGLKEAIKNQVTMFRPTTLTQAIGLALLQEGAMEAILKETKGSNRSGISTMTSLIVQGLELVYYCEDLALILQKNKDTFCTKLVCNEFEASAEFEVASAECV